MCGKHQGPFTVLNWRLLSSPLPILCAHSLSDLYYPGACFSSSFQPSSVCLDPKEEASRTSLCLLFLCFHSFDSFLLFLLSSLRCGVFLCHTYCLRCSRKKEKPQGVAIKGSIFEFYLPFVPYSISKDIKLKYGPAPKSLSTHSRAFRFHLNTEICLPPVFSM